MDSKRSGVRRMDMPEAPKHPELLEDDEKSVTGSVNIAQQDATKLEKEREEQVRKVKRKFQALREKLASTRYSKVTPDRRSRP